MKIILLLIVFLYTAPYCATNLKHYNYTTIGLGTYPSISKGWIDKNGIWMSCYMDSGNAYYNNDNNYRAIYYDHTKEDFIVYTSENSSLDVDTTGVTGVIGKYSEVWLNNIEVNNTRIQLTSERSITYDTSDMCGTVISRPIAGVDSIRWFNGRGDLLRLDMRDNSWTAYSMDTMNLEVAAFYTKFADSHGNIWLNHSLTYPRKKSSISRMDSTGVWYRYDSSNAFFTNTMITCTGSEHEGGMYEDRNRNVWFTRAGGITRYDGEQFYNYDVEPTLLPEDSLESFYNFTVDPHSDTVYIDGTHHTGIWDGDTLRYYLRSMVFPSDRYRYNFIDNNGQIWVDSGKGNHAVHNGNGWYKLSELSWWDSTIANEIGYAHIYDPRGGFWSKSTDTTTHGYIYHNLIRVTAEGYRMYNMFNTGPASDTLYDIAATNNYAYFAHPLGLTYRSRLDSSWECWLPNHFADSTGFLIDSIAALTSDETTLWAGTSSDYSDWPLAKLHKGTWSFIHRDSLGSSAISALELSTTGTLFIGTDSKIIRLKEGTFTTIDSGITVTDFTTKGDTLWAATDKGVFTYINGVSEELSTELFTALEIDHNGDLWAGRDESGAVLLTSTGSHEIVDLPGSSVRAIKRDSFDNIWIATEKGIGKWDGQNWFRYDSSNSVMKSNDIGSIALAPDGSKWFGTRFKGMIHLIDEDSLAVGKHSVVTREIRKVSLSILGRSLRISVPEQTNAAYTLIDLRGREIEKIDLGMITAGVHTVPLNNDFANGFYIVQFTAGTVTIQEKILIK